MKDEGIRARMVGKKGIDKVIERKDVGVTVNDRERDGGKDKIGKRDGGEVRESGRYKGKKGGGKEGWKENREERAERGGMVENDGNVEKGEG